MDVIFRFNVDLIRTLNFNKSSSVHLEESVVINYSSELSQAIPVQAKIMAPELKVTRDFIDFGISLVSQERCQQFSLRNPSSSSFIWKLHIENNENSVFNCNLKSGFIEASQFFVISQEQIISIYFTAKYVRFICFSFLKFILIIFTLN